MKQNTLLAINAILFLIVIVLFGFKFSSTLNNSIAGVNEGAQGAGTGVNDGFNRASLGANWTIISGKPVIIANTELGTTASPANAVLQWKASTFSSDQFSSAVISATQNTNVSVKVFVRRRASDGAHYSFVWNSGVSPAQWELKYDGLGTNNKILASGTAPTSIAGGTMRIEVIGSQITGYFNGAQVLTAQDTNITAGSSGIGFIQKSGTTITFPAKVINSWQGGNMVVAPAVIPKIPLTDMTASQTYLGFSGGLYENTTNTVPADHDTAGISIASNIVPLDTSGTPDPVNGKVLFMSIGMSNTTQEWCAQGYVVNTPCDSWSFTGQALADSRVNKTNLVFIDGAKGGQDAATWDQPTDPNYDRVATSILSPLGYDEKQVQVIWIKEANGQPTGTPTLPNTSADAYVLETHLGNIIRAAKVRYPNLKQVFLSSRIYGGYAITTTNPEPYAYESGFSVKWLVQAQIDQMRNGGAVSDTRAGDLNYQTGVAPWIAWGPYLWADGANPRSDGLTWVKTDFDPSDYTHPSQPGAPSDTQSGEFKVGGMLLNFFLNSPHTPWFR